MKPLQVLIVEDEALVAMMVEDAVEAAGHIVANSVTNITEAMTAVMRDGFDVALLDMNLNGQRAHSLPVSLKARGKPFAFVTGYGLAGVLNTFTDAPVVTKPFRYEDIASVLAKLHERLER